ncbi:methyl-accepting chemotaxis protein [Desulfitobacterium chlororespirans]|uniref:Methyl-accepting chemotaxis sensory transducer n=1 Tax=Desulfitobacterium chlororespirans DSM 11544 TaxID=1121395 RepID=A0A1M7UAV6_9FIRM|nr:methyl-accepting chemotaxis protein [Desulfitobacterium chlororespirans]SHN80058.1 methyl-accepting chemotaxis sensory transducer [Desulfitobacterium chlororespirans DSM 11544]
MLDQRAINSCKLLAEVLVDAIPGGAMFWLVEGNTVTWTKSSEKFGIQIVKTGDQLDERYSSIRAMKERTLLLNQSIKRSKQGERLIMSTLPYVDEYDQVQGAFNMAWPRIHPVIAAFGNFAPILAEMYHDGALLYISDLKKVVMRQASSRFDLQSFQLGQNREEDEAARQALSSQSPVILEMGEEKYGVPVTVANYPLFDEENKDEIVAILGIITPKKTAVELRQIAADLEKGLLEISAAVQQLTASAADIHTNEKVQNDKIREVAAHTEEIRGIMALIRKIADATNMLGFNAAIEATRAGKQGNGFGVVAEEIRKLSEQTRSTIPQIQRLTDSIQEKVNQINLKSMNSLQSSQGQAAATEEVTAGIQEISAMAEELNRIALLL